jgi:hypothetical protein
VPVKVNDNGCELKTSMVAGMVGIEAKSGANALVFLLFLFCKCRLTQFLKHPPSRERLDRIFNQLSIKSDIPIGCVSVPVKVNDNGCELKTSMVAGMVGIEATVSAVSLNSSNIHHPENGWIEFLTSCPSNTRAFAPDFVQKRKRRNV